LYSENNSSSGQKIGILSEQTAAGYGSVIVYGKSLGHQIKRVIRSTFMISYWVPGYSWE